MTLQSGLVGKTFRRDASRE